MLFPSKSAFLFANRTMRLGGSVPDHFSRSVTSLVREQLKCHCLIYGHLAR